MRPVHEFQENFDPTAADPHADPVADGLLLHEADSTVRNLCLVWADGRRAFFNYAYLVVCDLTLQDDINALVLSFGSYTVLLKGYYLASLFDALLEHRPKIITAINSRYLTRSDSTDSVVIEIVVTSE